MVVQAASTSGSFSSAGSALAVVLLLVSCFLLLPGVGRAATGQPAPQLLVRGEVELQVPADQLQISIGVVSEAGTPQNALEQNSAAMREVGQTLRRLGLEEQEVRTGHFAVQPRWGEVRSSRPGRDRPPEIIGYAVMNSFTVTTTKLELAGPLIEGVVRAGANRIGELVFGLAAPHLHRAEAIRQATSHAQAEAQELAAAAGVSLEEVLVLNLDPAARGPQPFQAARMELLQGEPPLAPGAVPVRAGVSVTYRIAPRRQP